VYFRIRHVKKVSRDLTITTLLTQMPSSGESGTRPSHYQYISDKHSYSKFAVDNPGVSDAKRSNHCSWISSRWPCWSSSSRHSGCSLLGGAACIQSSFPVCCGAGRICILDKECLCPGYCPLGAICTTCPPTTVFPVAPPADCLPNSLIITSDHCNGCAE
jgi:hypothetical protein